MKRRLLTDLNLTICVILGCLLVFMFSFKLIGGNPEKDFEKAAAVFEEGMSKVNDENSFPIPLKIAYGKAVYVPGTDSFDEAEKTADNLMYEHKKLLKANT